MKRVRWALAFAACLAVSVVLAPTAGATNYVQTGALAAGGGPVSGVAVDQSNGNVYAARFGGPDQEGTGAIARFSSSGTPLSPATMGEAPFASVTVDPSSPHDVYAVWSVIDTELVGFSQAGSELGSPFPISVVGILARPQIAATPDGGVLWPETDANAVKEYSSETGAVTQTITCSACPAPAAFSDPTAVAVDGAGNIYVVDSGNSRIVKFGPNGDGDPTSPTVFATVSASGGIAVNPANGNVFVAAEDGGDWHILEYDAAGQQISDFGTGSFQAGYSELFALSGPQLAVSSTTGVVYATDATEGFANGSVLVFAPADLPAATTEAATDVGSTTATLNGAVDPNGVSTVECLFEYTTKASFEAEGFAAAQAALCEPFPEDEEDPVQVSIDVAGLSPLTNYVYRVSQETEAGIAQGDAVEFTTLAAKPVATTQPASAVDQTTATLHATVDANGDDASCKFEYGTSQAYGSSVPCSMTPVPGDGAVAVSAPLTGLSVGTTYHFRVVASNAGGTTNGANMSFTTSSPSPPTPPQPPPPLPPSGPGPTPPGDGTEARKACEAKAMQAFKKAQKAAKRKKGKARARAMRAANKRKAKALAQCRAQFGKI